MLHLKLINFNIQCSSEILADFDGETERMRTSEERGTDWGMA